MCKTCAGGCCAKCLGPCGCNPAIHMYRDRQYILAFYSFIYFIIEQQSCEHFNLPILFRCNFNNFVILAKHKVKTH